MIQYTRRSALALTGIALIAGCTGSSDSSGGDSSDGGQNQANANTPVTKTMLDDYATVVEDEYKYWTFSLNQQVELDLRATVRSGPRIDIIFTSQEELQEFEEGNRFRLFDELSLLDTAGGDRSSTFGEGDYALILDNTNAGQAKPPTNFDEDNAKVEITVKGTIR